MESLKSHLDIGGDNLTVKHDFLPHRFKMVLRVLHKLDNFVVLGPVQAGWVDCLTNRESLLDSF
jgi:hypothetical protein